MMHRHMAAERTGAVYNNNNNNKTRLHLGRPSPHLCPPQPARCALLRGETAPRGEAAPAGSAPGPAQEAPVGKRRGRLPGAGPGWQRGEGQRGGGSGGGHGAEQ